MPLESTMICLDNSEWMRNGDYPPTRMEAQHDAANVLCASKTNSNPESTVGILSMAGRSVECLASPTEDIGKLLAVIHNVSIGGKSKFVNAIQVAQLALKHRRNKKGGQRIIAFVGSPLEEDTRALVKVGKLLKKNNVAADVVSFGDIDENQAKLQAFVDAANSNNNSHLVTIPAGMHPSDVLVSSAIFHGGEGGAPTEGASGGASGDNFAEYGGVDPSMDPELALALRVSMEEERARQEAASKKNAEDTAKSASEAQSRQETPVTSGVNPGAEIDEEEQLLSKALAMSMPANSNFADNDEDEAMQLALQMSMQQNESTGASSPGKNAESADAKSGTPPPAPASAAAFLDPSFVNSLLSDLPGVDPNDPKIQAAMAQINASAKKDDGSKKDDSKKDGSKK